jgi:hypothetical protein
VVEGLAVVGGNCFNTEIHVGRDSTVEVDLAPAIREPLRSRRKVDERKPDGLLELVDTIALEREQRDVGLASGDVLAGSSRPEPPLCEPSSSVSD